MKTTRGDRKTHYGLPIDGKEVAMTTKKTTKKMTSRRASKVSTFQPISDEIMPYGGKRYRTPFHQNEFVGTQGSKIPAYIFDIDGTLQGWGQGAQKDVLAWAEKHYKANPHAVFLIITARDHGSFGYTQSFNWVMEHFPYPFIGPFARPVDDPRFTTEFKRELAQGFEDMGLYQILGAADDNEWVIKMWKQWAIDHFEDPADFDLLECSYGSYGGWRSDLPSKGWSYGGKSSYGTSYGTVATGTHKGEHWVNGGNVDGKWQQGYWEKDVVSDTATHRPAGTSRWTSDPGERDLTKAVGWQDYLAKREKAGAYLAVEVDPERADLEDIVAHTYEEMTPAEIAAKSVDELRDLVGIEDEAREWILDNVTDWFKGRFTNAELALLSNEELNSLLDMTDAAAEDFIDKRWVQTQWDNDEAQTDPRAGKTKYRMDLEDEVYAEHEDLSRKEIERLGLRELELLMESAKRADDTQPLDVAEVLGEGEVA